MTNIRPWKTIKTDTVLSTPYVSVQSDCVEVPSGSVINDFYTVTIQDAVLVVALNENETILLIREYRYACKDVVVECPAGMIEDDEKPLSAAQRELLEETGFTSNTWTYLGPTLESTSKLTNTMHLFLAKDCIKVAEQKVEDSEGNIDVVEVSFKEAVNMVMDGTIRANSSAHAILKVGRLIGI